MGTALGRRWAMKTVIAAVLSGMLVTAAAHAASITNLDGVTAVLVIVEGESRVEVAIDAGSTETICPTGCFVTVPNGDHIGLQGDELIEIVNGSFVFK